MKTLQQVLNDAETIDQAINDWHLVRGGSMSDTTNPVEYSESQAQVIAEHKKQMDALPVYGNDTDWSFL